MRVKRDIMGNPTGTEIYGSWRKGGFWTEKDFEAEEPVQELMNRIDNLFDTSVVVDDKKFFESKQKMVKMIENTFKETLIPDHKAKLIQHIPYGADHNVVFAPIDPPRQVM
jgi:predicted transcriptional regulator